MSDETLLLKIVICLAIVDVALLILQFLHRLLLKNLVPSLSFQPLGHCRWGRKRAMGNRANAAGLRTGHGILDLGNLVEVLGVGQAKSTHTERMSRFLEMPLEIFPETQS